LSPPSARTLSNVKFLSAKQCPEAILYQVDRIRIQLARARD
jgi:hypothetical protein